MLKKPEKNNLDTPEFEDDSPELNQMIGWNKALDLCEAYYAQERVQEMDKELEGREELRQVIIDVMSDVQIQHGISASTADIAQGILDAGYVKLSSIKLNKQVAHKIICEDCALMDCEQVNGIVDALASKSSKLLEVDNG